MKTKLKLPALALLALLSTIICHPSTTFAQGTAFTYQGRLNEGTLPANGTYDFRFRLFGDSFGNTPVGSTQLAGGVSVTNGLFIATIDFGPGIFTGSNYWLDVGVRTNGAVNYTGLTPLQALTPAPYAIFANTASNLSGTLPAGQLNGTVSSANLSGTYGNAVTFNNAGNSFSGDGSGLTGINAATLNGLGSGNFWQTGGNAGTTAGSNFVGTADNQPLEIHVNGVRAFRLEPTVSVPNFIGGYSSNAVLGGAVGATIGGGGASDGNPNLISSTLGTIGGGSGNVIGTNANDATIGGGRQNGIADNNSGAVISGGHGNQSTASFQFPNANYSTVSGGYQNQVGDPYATIGGGLGNTIASYGQGALIGGGVSNVISYSTFSGNFGGSDSTIAGGGFNRVSCDYGTIGGGYSNAAVSLVAGAAPTVSGGHGNTAYGGGAVPGGESNYAGFDSFAAGDNAQATSAHAFVWGDGSGTANDNGANTFNVLASRGMVLTVSGSSGLNPAALLVNSTSANGVGLYVAEGSSDAAFVVNNAGTGDIIKGFNGGGNPVFEVVHSGAVNASAFNVTSDRNAKENFAAVNAQSVLAKVSALPITEWNYKTDRQGVQHLGPMAQDFHAAFGLNGDDDKHISVVDEGGVALAAIQGLNQKLEETQLAAKAKDAEIQTLKQQNDTLAERLNELETTVKQLTAPK